jgi:hypothetical protein
MKEGERLERVGVIADEVVRPTSQVLVEGKNPVLA